MKTAAKVILKMRQTLNRIAKNPRNEGDEDEDSYWSESQESDEDSFSTDEYTDEQTDDLNDEDESGTSCRSNSSFEETDEDFDEAEDEEDEDDRPLGSMGSESAYFTPTSHSTGQTREDFTTIASTKDELSFDKSPTANAFSPRRWLLKSPLNFVKRGRMFHSNKKKHTAKTCTKHSLENSSQRDMSAPDSDAIQAAEALGKDLETMGYNLECRSFITKEASRDLSEQQGVDRYNKRPPQPLKRHNLSLEDTATTDPVMENRSLSSSGSAMLSVPPSQVPMTRSSSSQLSRTLEGDREKIVLQQQQQHKQKKKETEDGQRIIKPSTSGKSIHSEGCASIEASQSHHQEKSVMKKHRDIHERTVIEVSFIVSPSNSVEDDSPGVSATSSTAISESQQMLKEETPKNEETVERPLRISTDCASPKSLPPLSPKHEDKSPRSPKSSASLASPRGAINASTKSPHQQRKSSPSATKLDSSETSSNNQSSPSRNDSKLKTSTTQSLHASVSEYENRQTIQKQSPKATLFERSEEGYKSSPASPGREGNILPPQRLQAMQNNTAAKLESAASSSPFQRERTGEISESTLTAIQKLQVETTEDVSNDDVQRERSINTESTNSILPRNPSSFINTVNMLDVHSPKNIVNQRSDTRYKVIGEASTGFAANTSPVKTVHTIVETVEAEEDSLEQEQQQMHGEDGGDIGRERSENTISTLSFFPKMPSVFSSTLSSPINVNKSPVNFNTSAAEDPTTSEKQAEPQRTSVGQKQLQLKRTNSAKTSDVIIEGISFIEEEGGISVCEETDCTAANEENKEKTAVSSRSFRASLLQRAVDTPKNSRHGDASTLPPKPPRSSDQHSSHKVLSPKSLPVKLESKGSTRKTNMALQALRESLAVQKSKALLKSAKRLSDSHSVSSVEKEAKVQTAQTPAKEIAVTPAGGMKASSQRTTDKETAVHGMIKEDTAKQAEEKRPSSPMKNQIVNKYRLAASRNKILLAGKSESKRSGATATLEVKHRQDNWLQVKLPAQTQGAEDSLMFERQSPRIFGWRPRSVSPEKLSRRNKIAAGWRKLKTKTGTEIETADEEKELKETSFPDKKDGDESPDHRMIAKMSVAPLCSNAVDDETAGETAADQEQQPSKNENQEQTSDQQLKQETMHHNSGDASSSLPEAFMPSKWEESCTPGSNTTLTTPKSPSNRRRVIRFSRFKKKDGASEPCKKTRGTTRGILKKMKNKNLPNTVEAMKTEYCQLQIDEPVNGEESEEQFLAKNASLSPVATGEKQLAVEVHCFGELSENVEVNISSPEIPSASSAMFNQNHICKLDAIKEVDSKFEEDTIKSLNIGKGIEMDQQGILLAERTDSPVQPAELTKQDVFLSHDFSEKKRSPTNFPISETNIEVTKIIKTNDAAKKDHFLVSFDGKQDTGDDKSRPVVKAWSLMDNVFACASVEGTGVETYMKTQKGLCYANGEPINALADDTSIQEKSDISSSAQSSSIKRVDKPLPRWWSARIFECHSTQLSNLTCMKASPLDYKTAASDIAKDHPSEGLELEQPEPAQDTKLAKARRSLNVASLAQSTLAAVETNCAPPTSAYSVLRTIQSGLINGGINPLKKSNKSRTRSKNESSGTHSTPSVLDPTKNPDDEKLLKKLNKQGPSFSRRHKVPSRLIIDLDYDEGSCLTSLPSGTAAHHNNRKRSGENLSSKSIDSTDAEVWEEIAKASLVVETAIKNMIHGQEEQKSDISAIGIDIEKALDLLKFHADRLGVKESDLLLAVKSYDTTENMSAAMQSKPTSIRKDDADNTSCLDTSVPSGNELTLGQEILEAFKMYIKDSKIV